MFERRAAIPPRHNFVLATLLSFIRESRLGSQHKHRTGERGRQSRARCLPAAARALASRARPFLLTALLCVCSWLDRNAASVLHMSRRNRPLGLAPPLEPTDEQGE